MLSGIAIVLTISAGSIIDSDKLPNQKLYLSTEGCPYVENGTVLHSEVKGMAGESWKDGEYSTWIKIVSLAPTWYPGLGNIGTIVFGLIFSFAFMKLQVIVPVKRDYLSPHILSLWEKVLPPSWINGWVEPKTKEEKEEEFIEKIS